VFGTHGVTAELIALPEFIFVVASARLIETFLRAQCLPDPRILLGANVALLLAFFVLAVRLGPFPDSDSPAALLADFAGIAAMAIQNAVHRVHFGVSPPTTIMTGNTTQATLDAMDLLSGAAGGQTTVVRARLWRTLSGIFAFAAGCAVAALFYASIGFWCLAVPVVVGAGSAIVPIKD
jgi:uncharacterized membrane protein YoaK (UPF0700 family)